MSAPAAVCSRCAAAITPDELVQGLAVRMDGQPVCPACVDGLPAPTRERIDRLRQLRGVVRRTYQVRLKRLPRVAAFTFSTAMAMQLHRRALAGPGGFSAPPYVSTTRRRRGEIALVAAVGLLIGCGVWLLVRATAPPVAREGGAPPPQAVAPEVPVPPAPTSPAPVIPPAPVDDGAEEVAVATEPAPAPQRIAPVPAVAAPPAVPVPVRPPSPERPPRATPVVAPVAAAPVSPVPTIASAAPVPPVAPVPSLVAMLFPPDLPVLAPGAEAAVPAPWPSLAWGPAAGTSRATLDGRRFSLSRRGELAFSVPAAAVRDGGLLLVIHPGDQRRTALAAWCDDAPLPPLALGAPRWSVQALALPRGGDVLRVRLADRGGATAPFAVAALVAVAGAPPRTDLLRAVTGHLPATLATHAGEDALRERIAAADDARRRAGDPTFAAEPGLLRWVRVAGGGLPATAVTALRARLVEVQGGACRRGQVEEAGEPAAGEWRAWFRQAQLLAPSQARRLAPGEQYGVLLLLSPGAGDRHAVAGTAALARELRDLERLALVGEPRERRAGGLVLVVGIGGYDAPDAPLPEGLAQARTALRRACEASGTPFIDAVAASEASTAGKAARGEALARLLGDGLACLATQFARFAPGKPR